MEVVYGFQCDKTLAQMLEALRAGTPWKWKETVNTMYTASFGKSWSGDCLRARMPLEALGCSPRDEA